MQISNNKHWGKYWNELQQNNSVVIKTADCGCLFALVSKCSKILLHITLNRMENVRARKRVGDGPPSGWRGRINSGGVSPSWLH